MSFLNWFEAGVAPEPSARLKELVRKVLVYLMAQPDDAEILPKFVAKAIGESELAAATALRILRERGITQEHFGVYCGDKALPLGIYDDPAQIPEKIPCLDCDASHSTRNRDVKVQVFYTVDLKELERQTRVLSAA